MSALTTEAFQTGNINKGFGEIDSNGDNIVRRLTKLLIYKYSIKRNGDPLYKDGITDRDSINWRTLHLLIEFIKNYEQKEINLAKTPLDNNTINKNKRREKERNSNKKESNPGLDGQLSFKDLINNNY